MRACTTVALVAFVLLSAPSPAEACSCTPRKPVCETAWNSDVEALFIGRVEEIAVLPGKGPTIFRQRLVRFRVSEVFRGAPGAVVEVQTGAGGGDCGYRFREGSEYLVDARYTRRFERLYTGLCMLTAGVEAARDDIAYLRAAFRDNAPLGRVAGRIEQSERNLSRRTNRLRPAAELNVVAEREGQETRAITDSAGRFEMHGLEPGQYRLRVDVPATHYAEFPLPVVELADRRGCVETAGIVAFDGRVRGRVIDRDGRGLPGLTVDLTVSGLEYPEGAERIQAVTNADGDYEIARVPPGSYLIGVNTAPQDEEPKLPRLFHPGVTSIRQATRVKLGPGERTAIAPLVLPATVRTVTVSGLVLDADGAPAAGAQVFLAGRFVRGAPVAADANGRFTLTAFEGFEYQVFAVGEPPHARSVTSSDIQTFTATANMPPLRVVLRRRY